MNTWERLTRERLATNGIIWLMAMAANIFCRTSTSLGTIITTVLLISQHITT